MRLIVLGALLAVACEPPRLRVVVLTDRAAWAHGLESHFLAVAEDAAREWGGNPESLGGWELTVSDRSDPMCGEHAGCARPSTMKISVAADYGSDIPEARELVDAVVAHEVGHVVLGAPVRFDPDHTDPRWQIITPPRRSRSP